MVSSSRWDLPNTESVWQHNRSICKGWTWDFISGKQLVLAVHSSYHCSVVGRSSYIYLDTDFNIARCVCICIQGSTSYNKDVVTCVSVEYCINLLKYCIYTWATCWCCCDFTTRVMHGRRVVKGQQLEYGKVHIYLYVYRTHFYPESGQKLEQIVWVGAKNLSS